MFKSLTLLFVSLLISTQLLRAQAIKPLFERYVDFNLEHLTGDSNTALAMGEALLDSVSVMQPKLRINFYNSIGKLYEDNGQTDKAITYYEKVALAVPNYYVVHRALGYIYLASANQLLKQLSEYKPADPVYIQLKDAYKRMVLKALPHLEIAQACDPSEETLAIIKNMYINIADKAGLNSLDKRLKTLSNDCLDILSEN